MHDAAQKLKAKVKAINGCHLEAMRIRDQLVSIFRPLVDQKLTKVDGGLLAKIVKQLPEFTNSGKLSVYRHTSDYSLAWTVKACEQIQGSHGCLYYETTVYIGDLSNGVLQSISNRPEYRTDFTEEEILGKRAACRAAKEAYTEARSAMFPFGEEYDS